MWPVVVAFPFAYLLGTFPTALLVARAHGHDPLREGSGNPGASNVLRLVGWKGFAAVMAVDFAKGAVASGVGLALAGRPGAFVLGAAAVLGHTFPIVRKGGKGVAAAGGMLVVLYPWIVLGLGVAWALVAKVARKASLASLLIALAFPVLVWATGHHLAEVAVIGAMALFVVVRHAANIRRLVHGEEHDLRAPSESPPDGPTGA